MAVDIGAEAIDREYSYLAGYTIIAKDNPANASGTITSVEIWADELVIGCVVGTFYATNGNTLKCRDSVAIGNVFEGSKQTFSGLAIAVEIGDYIGCYYTDGAIDLDTSGGADVWGSAGEHIDPNDEADYTASPNRVISLGGYIGAAPTNYDRSATVLIGNKVSFSRELALDRAASVLVGNLVSVTRAIAVGRDASVLIGNLVSATRALAVDRASSVLIGIKVSATRTLDITRTASVLIGELVSFSKIFSPGGITEYVRSAIVYIGVATSASRRIAVNRSALVLMGNLVSFSRALAMTRTSSVSIGVLVSATRLWNAVRKATVKIGIKVTISYCTWLKRLLRVPISRLKATRLAISRTPLSRRVRSCFK